MTYNKSEIMKNAWKTFRICKAKNIGLIKRINGKFQDVKYTFSDALIEAWDEAKKEQAKLQAKKEQTNAIDGDFVIGSEINIGDRVEIEYGDYDNWMDVEVTGISACDWSEKYLVIKAQCISNPSLTNIEFCLDINKSFHRLYTNTTTKAA